ncbi:MAG: hypothetical protein Q9163_005562 [Psora crenata]
MYSNQLDSCVPEPVCQSKTYSLKSLDGIMPNTKFLGDSSKADWVSSGTPLQAPTKDSVILTLSEEGQSSSGTLLASTTYVWYGKITAQMKSSRGAGVVSAFILLSNNKDEIDFEFVGADLSAAQSNFYFQGITDSDDNGQNISMGDSDTFSEYHSYEIDWQPDQLTWSIDGNVKRTLKKSDTFNKTDNQYHYPQTPSRVQLSLWPAGISKNAKGTIEWAGGLIDWNSQDVKNNGYYYSVFKEVDIQCYNPPSKANKTGDTSYIYNDRTGVESSIAITDKSTVLKSLLGTGTDMDKDYPKAKASGTSTGSNSTATSDVATIPGLTGAGPGTDGTRGGGGGGGGGDADSNSGSGSSGSGSTGTEGSSTTGAAGAGSTGIGGFTQGDQDGTSDAMKGEQLMAGSMFAALMTFVGMLLL